MQPNNPYPPNQQPPASQYPQPTVPSDYLNSIAAPTPVKILNPLILWGLIAAALIVIIIVVVVVASTAGSGSGKNLAGVGARASTLREVSAAAQKNIQSSQLRTLNSSLTLVLTDANRELTAPLKAQEINLKDAKNTSIVAVKKDFADLEKRLEDARLNGVFDRTYAREMTFQLKTLNTDMGSLYDSSRSKSLKKILNDANETLTPLIEEFNSFNDA